MSALLDEETTTVVLKGLDFDVPCRKGEHAAEVTVTCRGCGHVEFSCRPHYEALRAKLDAEASTYGRRIIHKRCGFVAKNVDGLVEVSPL